MARFEFERNRDAEPGEWGVCNACGERYFVTEHNCHRCWDAAHPVIQRLNDMHGHLARLERAIERLTKDLAAITETSHGQ